MIVVVRNGDLVGTALRTDSGPLVSTLISVVAEPSIRGKCFRGWLHTG